MAFADSSLGYSKPSNLPPLGVVSWFSLASRVASRLSSSVFSTLDAGVDAFVSSGASPFWKGETRYVIIMGLPFWNDLMYITFSLRHRATERPVLPIGTLPISIGELME